MGESSYPRRCSYEQPTQLAVTKETWRDLRDRGRFKAGLIVISFSLGFLAVSLNLVSDHAKAGVWFVEQVDPFGNVGYYTSIAIDSVGNPHIGYFDISNEDLKYASWDGISWVIETVEIPASSRPR